MSEALSDTISCVELISGLNPSIAKKFRARARAIPTLVFTNGFAYTITLLAARSSKSLIELGFRENCKSIVDEATKFRVDDEELSYGLYGAILLHLLRKMGALKAVNFREVVAESLRDIAVDMKAMQVVEWLKRFTEAYIAEK